MASDPAGQPPLLTAAPPATLHAVLAAHAARQPAHTFLVTPENGRTYTLSLIHI